MAIQNINEFLVLLFSGKHDDYYAVRNAKLEHAQFL